MNGLHKRILEISKKFDLSHLGSCLTACDIIDLIYNKKKIDEPFVLSCGHASLALFVVLEKHLGKDAEALCLKHGTHPNRDLEDGVYCSTGSLGMGITVAVGMALADRRRNVYVLISDGEAFEGSVYEAANVIHKYHIDNLKVHLNWNGWGAYQQVNRSFIERIKVIFPKIWIHETNVKDYGFIGQESHYIKL